MVLHWNRWKSHTSEFPGSCGSIQLCFPFPRNNKLRRFVADYSFVLVNPPATFEDELAATGVFSLVHYIDPSESVIGCTGGPGPFEGTRDTLHAEWHPGEVISLNDGVLKGIRFPRSPDTYHVDTDVQRISEGEDWNLFLNWHFLRGDIPFTGVTHMDTNFHRSILLDRPF